MSKSSTLEFSVLGRDFSVVCPDNEQKNLLAAAQYLDQKMREIQQAGKVTGQDRIAIMAGLNIAYELLTAQNGTDNSMQLRQQVVELEGQLDEALAPQNQLFAK